MDSLSLIQLLSVFGAGLLAALSPCVFPLLPITFGFISTATSRWGVIAYAVGQAITLTALGVMAVTLGEALGFTSSNAVVRAVVGGVLIGFGIISLSPRLSLLVSTFAAFAGANAKGDAPRGLFRSFLLGASSALVLSPCTTPVLGAVLAVIATEGSIASGAVLMAVYAIGFTSLLLAAGLGLLSLKRLPRSGPWLARIHVAGGVSLVAAGIWFIAT